MLLIPSMNIPILFGIFIVCLINFFRNELNVVINDLIIEENITKYNISWL